MSVRGSERWIIECEDPARWIARLAARSAPEGECIVWTGATNVDGYGKFTTRGHRVIGTHRASWLAHRGPIEPGLVIDHICRNRRCVNPEHLEPVTTKVNIGRGLVPLNSGARRGPRDRSLECSWGHPRNEENTRWAVNKAGYRIQVCRPCQRRRMSEWKARQK